MIFYLINLMIYVVVFPLGLALAPILPLFAENRDGKVNNGNDTAIEPRLPTWLSWFDTSYDNSLWGDNGWRTEHHPDDYKTYQAMVRWLWRNCACGFCWYGISHAVSLSEVFTVVDSGNGLSVDKGRGIYGWFLIKSDYGAFHFRWCKRVGRFVFSLELGWLLTIYVDSLVARAEKPLAAFQFQPQLIYSNSKKII